jgi:hypothetical protein
MNTFGAPAAVCRFGDTTDQEPYGTPRARQALYLIGLAGNYLPSGFNLGAVLRARRYRFSREMRGVRTVAFKHYRPARMV